MINCPNCGTANQDESRFCSKCGTTLSAPAGRRCPMCGRMNPAANIFCDSCGARLVPATPASAAAPEPKPAAPSRPAAGSTVVKKGLPSPAKPKEEPPAPPPPPSPHVEAPGESDDWLTRLRGNLPESPAPDESVPDWLHSGEPESAESVQASPTFDLAARLGGSEPTPTPSAPATEVPDWLAQFAPKTPASLAPTAPAASELGNVPDWLRELAPTAKPPPPQPVTSAPVEVETPRAASPVQFEPPPAPSTLPVAPSFAEVDVPDWLKQPLPGESVQASAPVSTPPVFEPSTFAESMPAEAGIPDWLSQLETPPPVVPAQGAPLAIEPETPPEAWLQNLAPTTPSAPEPASTAFVGEAISEPTEAPLWLKAMEVPPAGPAEPVPTAPAQAELPDWLKDLQVPSAVPEPEMTPVAPLPFKEPEAVPPAGLPDWLKELKSTEVGAPVPPALTETPAISPTAGGLVAAQLPSWLKELQPTGAMAEPEKEEPAETEGVLEGVRGALPAAEIISQALGVGLPRPINPEIPASDLARAGALQELLARGAGAVVRREGESPAQKLWSNAQRWMVFLVIAILAVFPLVQPNLVYGLVSAPPLDKVNEDMFNNIQALPLGAGVLVAFDYDATQSPEMDTQARVLLRHLAARKANIKVASLYPAGPAVAQTVINQINGTLTGTLPIKVEQRGYLPGQDAAVAYFIQSTPISMVVELAATPDTVRWWAEQLAARSDAPTFLAGVSASAEPMSQPYVQSRQVSGMMVGVPGATAYRLKLREVLQDDTDGMAEVLAPLTSIGLANVALVALMVLGALVQLVSGRRPQPATRSGGRQRG